MLFIMKCRDLTSFKVIFVAEPLSRWDSDILSQHSTSCRVVEHLSEDLIPKNEKLIDKYETIGHYFAKYILLL